MSDENKTEAAETAPPAADLPESIKVLERFFPKEAGPLFDLFDGAFTTAKLWAAFGAVAVVGPKVEALLGGNWSPAIPATTISISEKVESAKNAIAQAEPVITGLPGEEPCCTMNPLLAATLAALIDEVMKYAKSKLLS